MAIISDLWKLNCFWIHWIFRRSLFKQLWFFFWERAYVTNSSHEPRITSNKQISNGSIVSFFKYAFCFPHYHFPTSMQHFISFFVRSTAPIHPLAFHHSIFSLHLQDVLSLLVLSFFTQIMRCHRSVAFFPQHRKLVFWIPLYMNVSPYLCGKLNHFGIQTSLMFFFTPCL